MTLKDPHLHVTRWSWALYWPAGAEQLMCINCICNRYGHLVSGLVTGLNLWALMCGWSIMDSFCHLERVSSYYGAEMSPFSFCLLNLKLAKYGRKWNLKGDCVSGIHIETDYKDGKVRRVCDVLTSSSAPLSGITHGSEVLCKTIIGVFYFKAGCLDDNSSLVTLVFKMWLYPLAFTLISTYVHSGSLWGLLLKVGQGLKILSQSRIWQLFMKLTTCTFSRKS